MVDVVAEVRAGAPAGPRGRVPAMASRAMAAPERTYSCSGVDATNAAPHGSCSASWYALGSLSCGRDAAGTRDGDYWRGQPLRAPQSLKGRPAHDRTPQEP